MLYVLCRESERGRRVIKENPMEAKAKLCMEALVCQGRAKGRADSLLLKQKNKANFPKRGK